MRTLAALAAGFTLAALTLPLIANSAPTTRTDAVTQLQRRVTNLERSLRALGKVVKDQIDIDTSQRGINAAFNSRLSNLELPKPAPKLTVTTDLGTPAIINPRTWGNASASCLVRGTLIGSGFSTNSPVMVGTSLVNGAGTELLAFNPYDQQAVLTPYAICLSLG